MTLSAHPTASALPFVPFSLQICPFTPPQSRFLRIQSEVASSQLQRMPNFCVTMTQIARRLPLKGVSTLLFFSFSQVPVSSSALKGELAIRVFSTQKCSFTFHAGNPIVWSTQTINYCTSSLRFSSLQSPWLTSPFFKNIIYLDYGLYLLEMCDYIHRKPATG